jgi:hypothetical protein
MHEQFLLYKRILFLAPSFFGYENIIKSKLEYHGARVHLYNIRPVKNIFLRAILKYLPFLFSKLTIQLYMKILSELNDINFDFIFLIKPYQFNATIIKLLKKRFPTAKLILYLWDSVKNSTESKLPSIFQYFDRVYSFDKIDSIKYNLCFLPLFYSEEKYNQLSISPGQMYDLAFVGTIHSDKLNVIHKIEKISKSNGFTFFSYKFILAKFVYYFQRIYKKSFSYYSLEDFHFKPLTYSKVIEIFSRSKAILDVHSSSQTGLTMRTFETLGIGRKLVTTNKDIKNYDFYNPNNIMVIDRKSPIVEKDFFESNFDYSTISMIKKYELNNWILTIFNIHK